MASPIKLILKNPKKSFLFLGIASTSLWYTYDYTFTNDVMKTSCRKAAEYGNQRLKSPNAQVRHITVILNPVAGKRKSKKLYTKWVEPLLHLAGIKVSLIETNSPNQAYELMKIMSNCDGVAIVGGDGTVHEAINGLLHRPDSAKAVKEFPIGIIPTGQYNSIARYVHQGYVDYRNQKEFLINATLRLVDSCMAKYDVIKISPLDEDINQKKQPTYALRDIRYGVYQDNFFKVSGFKIYESYIKPLWLRLQRTISTSKYPNPQIDSISYTKPCIGCSRCYDRHRLNGNKPEKVEQKSTNSRWWGMLAPVSKSNSGPTEEEKMELELSKRDNPECGQWINIGDSSKVTDFRACMMGDKKVRLSLGRHREYKPSDVTETQDVRLKVSQELDNDLKIADQQKEENKENNDNESKELTKSKESDKKPIQLLIDGQPSPAHSVEITAINKAVTIFTGPFRILP